jgi:hypothetical protein
MALFLLRTFSPLRQVFLYYIFVTTNEVSLSMQHTILCITPESRALLKCDRGLTILIYTNITRGISPEHYFVYNELNLSRHIENYEPLFRDAIPIRYYLRFGDWRVSPLVI